MSGAYQSPLRRRSATTASLVLLALLAACGCKKQPEITRYQVPKEKLPAAMPAASPGELGKAASKKPGEDRMLAAIVPHGDSAWFFKLAGNGEAVEKQRKAFESIVQSVTFPKSGDAKPEWKSPEGWEQIEGPSPRYATLFPPAESGVKSLELTVTELGWTKENEKKGILENVNRWRSKQMQLPPLAEDELDAEISKLKLADGEAITVDLKGTYTEGMRPQVDIPRGGTEN